MTKEENKKLSKKMSYVLRHHPEDIGITLDEYGWADTTEFCNKIGYTLEDISEVVGTRKSDNFGSRFRFNEDASKLKANQGHSIPIKNDMDPIIPPTHLYHGTNENVVDIIKKEGLKPMSRVHVHLSKDIATATEVAGRRGGKNVILVIDTEAMYKDGVKIYMSENGVYLTDFVDPKYIE